MTKAEKRIGELCMENAKNKDQCMKFLGKYQMNRQERKLRDKEIERNKRAMQEETLNKEWN